MLDADSAGRQTAGMNRASRSVWFRSAVAAALLCTACSQRRTQVPFGPVGVSADGGPFATVVADAEPRPYTWPLFGPGGVAMTRNHPMGTREGETRDHPHHQSLWFAHGDVDGFDFWHGTDERERLVLTSLHRSTIRGDGVVSTVIEAGYDWTVGEGRVLLREARKLVFTDRGDHRTVDLVTTLVPDSSAVTFGDTKEGTFALRVHPALRAEGAIATGRLSNSEGDTGKKARAGSTTPAGSTVVRSGSRCSIIPTTSATRPGGTRARTACWPRIRSARTTSRGRPPAPATSSSSPVARWCCVIASCCMAPDGTVRASSRRGTTGSPGADSQRWPVPNGAEVGRRDAGARRTTLRIRPESSNDPNPIRPHPIASLVAVSTGSGRSSQ